MAAVGLGGAGAAAVAQADHAGVSGVPLAALTTVWSQPPVAVIGMEAGTPAAYALIHS